MICSTRQPERWALELGLQVCEEVGRGGLPQALGPGQPVEHHPVQRRVHRVARRDRLCAATHSRDTAAEAQKQGGQQPCLHHAHPRTGPCTCACACVCAGREDKHLCEAVGWGELAVGGLLEDEVEVRPVGLRTLGRLVVHRVVCMAQP